MSTYLAFSVGAIGIEMAVMSSCIVSLGFILGTNAIGESIKLDMMRRE